MLVTASTFQFEMSPLKLVALGTCTHVRHRLDVPVRDVAVEARRAVNMLLMVVTVSTFQFGMSPLKLVAPLNMLYMLVTVSTFQFEMSPLKLVAPEHVTHVRHRLDVPVRDVAVEARRAVEHVFMFVTASTFQFEMSPLKLVALRNMYSRPSPSRRSSSRRCR